MIRNFARITPKLLTWARERRGLSYERVGRSVGVSADRIVEWERGNAPPPFGKAISLANALRVPLPYLFLQEPPAIDIPLPDLRKLTDTETREPSVDFLELLYEVIAKQQWYREHLEAQDAKELPFVSRFTTRDSVVGIAENIRETLGLENALRRQASSWSDYLSLLSDHAEGVGVLVMRSGVVGNNTQRPLSVREFQGFAITDRLAPLVFVNGADFKTAQIFTLAHEFAHIWIGKSGISNPDQAEPVSTPKDAPFLRVTPPDELELFCNAIAAETLVPREEFLSLPFLRPLDLQRLARYFFVSTLVILRRARELGLITSPDFQSLLEAERGRQQEAPGTGGDYWRNIPARHSRKLTEAVLQEVRQGTTTFRTAAKLLDLKVPTLERLLETRRD